MSSLASLYELNPYSVRAEDERMWSLKANQAFSDHLIEENCGLFNSTDDNLCPYLADIVFANNKEAYIIMADGVRFPLKLTEIEHTVQNYSANNNTVDLFESFRCYVGVF
jgi:hypothetical protein